MRIEIKTVPPAAMRYPTAGDWEWLPDGALKLTVPDYGTSDESALLVAIHEMVEAFLCKRDGVTDEEVTRFDTENPKLEEPGDDPLAPYHKQHTVAMAIERDGAIGFGVDWHKHNQWVTNAGNEVERLWYAKELQQSRILMQGPRYWAELHLYAMRVDDQAIPLQDVRYWLDDWMRSLPFDGCPCEKHLKEWVSENPPTYIEFFHWTVNLHNAVNERLFKPTLSVADSRKLWESRLF
jgi:hypothetical protein